MRGKIDRGEEWRDKCEEESWGREREGEGGIKERREYEGVERGI